MNEIHLPKTKVAELHAICAERNNDPGELINILHAAQGLFGYLPPEVQQVIAAEYPGLKGIWRSYFLLILYDDPQGEIPHLGLSGNGLLRAWRGKCSGRNATSIGNKGRRDYTGRFVLLGLLTLCRCLRIGSGGHDRREGLWKGYSREGTGYTFRLLSERAIRYENTSGHIRFYVTACIK